MVKHNMVFLLHPHLSSKKEVSQGGGTQNVESNSQNQQSWGFGMIPDKLACSKVAKLFQLQQTLLQPEVQLLHAVLGADTAAQGDGSLSA